MKKIFLRKILPMALCLLMVIPFFAFSSFAMNMSTIGEPGDRSVVGDEKMNVAPEGQGYHSSVWNLDRHSKYLNNGTYNHSYQFWAPNHWQRNPDKVSKDHDNTKEYVGFTFDEHYLVDEIVIYTGSYDKGNNNIKYSIDALILGEWQEIGYGYQDDGVVDYSISSEGRITKINIKVSHPDGDAFTLCSKCQTVGEKSAKECAACGSKEIKLYNDINTNNIRIRFTEYGEHAQRTDGTQATSHDWWLVPNVQEIEILGYTGYKPEFDVPMGAFLVTNAAISGMIGYNDQCQPNSYPGRAGDNDTGTFWKARRKGAATVWSEFNQMYTIENVGFSLSAVSDKESGSVFTYNIYILKEGTVEDGVWEKVVSDATASPAGKATSFVHDLKAPTDALAMKIEFTSVVDANGDDTYATVAEFQAQIANGGKCIFLGDYITESKKASTATGNLACYGTAYASSNFGYAGVSKVSYLIDGNATYDDESWIALDYILGTYAGVTLKEAHEVTKVVLYFDDVLGGTDGKYTFNFDVQANVNGKFVTIGKGTSYDAGKKQYLASIVLDTPVYTDDIRIVFTSDAQTFPYIKEIEIFSGSFVYSSYSSGFTLDTSRTKGGPAATTEFGYRTVAQRGRYFNKISPISYFNIALEYDVEIDWLG